MKPILDELTVEYKNQLNVVIVSVDEYKDLTNQYRIMAIPTQIFFDSNGREIGRDDVLRLISRIKPVIESMASESRAKQPTFFEATTSMAFLYFAENDVDFAVIEVGLGGRLDATNVIVPLVSVITRIALEHT
jgi:thioredoxin-like negative regulator of GroEL